MLLNPTSSFLRATASIKEVSQYPEQSGLVSTNRKTGHRQTVSELHVAVASYYHLEHIAAPHEYDSLSEWLLRRPRCSLAEEAFTSHIQHRTIIYDYILKSPKQNSLFM